MSDLVRVRLFAVAVVGRGGTVDGVGVSSGSRGAGGGGGVEASGLAERGGCGRTAYVKNVRL